MIYVVHSFALHSRQSERIRTLYYRVEEQRYLELVDNCDNPALVAPRSSGILRRRCASTSLLTKICATYNSYGSEMVTIMVIPI